LRDAFSSPFFIPRGHGYLWKPSLLALQASASAAWALGCFAIAASVLVLMARGRARGVRGPLLALAIFAGLSGLSHVFDIWLIWNPIYWIDGGVRVAGAVAALALALALPRLVRRDGPPADRPGAPSPHERKLT
jgi:hypothetical protein